eukprot:gene3103-6093_t
MRAVPRTMTSNPESYPLVQGMDYSIDRTSLQPMDRFRRYEEEFLNSMRILNQSLRQLERPNGNTDTILSLSVDIEGELAEAEAYLRAMDFEFRAMVSSEKRSISEKVSAYKTEYTSLVSTFKTIKHSAESYALKANAHNQLNRQSASEKLDKTTESLEHSRRIVADTENIGRNVITDLTSQKEKIISASQNVQETKNVTFDTKLILQKMGTKAFLKINLAIGTHCPLKLAAIYNLMIANESDRSDSYQELKVFSSKLTSGKSNDIANVLLYQIISILSVYLGNSVLESSPGKVLLHDCVHINNSNLQSPSTHTHKYSTYIPLEIYYTSILRHSSQNLSSPLTVGKTTSLPGTFP